jgi:hypothetical protein
MRGGLQTQFGHQAIANISQLLHRKGQTHAPPDTDERSLAIGRFHEAPLNARMLSQHVYPTVGQREELDNDCLYIYHPSTQLDLQSLLALRPILADHSPDLIDNLYLTGVYSTESATANAYIGHLYIPESTPADIANIMAAQLEDVQKQGIQTSLKRIHNIMTVDPMTDTLESTFLDDNPIAPGNYETSPHLERIPHAHVVTLPHSPTLRTDSHS